MSPDELVNRLKRFPCHRVGHYPTPIESLPRLSEALDIELYIKREDCTGLAFGGNKVRQLEYYFGDALSQAADTILITGAVQSNFVRVTAAFAARLGFACHVQLEERVSAVSALYRTNGNVMLDQLFGATLHSFPVGEDETAADAALADIARSLAERGARPYIIPLGIDHPPIGALGYVEAAIELKEQSAEYGTFDEIFVASGSASTHSGLLTGLRALEMNTPVRGVCVRRLHDAQQPRIARRCADLIRLLELCDPNETQALVSDADIHLYDQSFAPGYGKLNPAVIEAVRMAARLEGLLIDPVYTGRVMAGLIDLARTAKLFGPRVLFCHTGGEPSLFAYADQLRQ